MKNSPSQLPRGLAHRASKLCAYKQFQLGQNAIPASDPRIPKPVTRTQREAGGEGRQQALLWGGRNEGLGCELSPMETQQAEIRFSCASQRLRRIWFCLFLYYRELVSSLSVEVIYCIDPSA